MSAPNASGDNASGKIPFTKPPLSIEQMVAQLQARGLTFADLDDAKRCLCYIGYYRLSGYALPFQVRGSETPHEFVAGTTFDDILDQYIFDRELRLLLMDAVERIEVAVRSVISDTMSLQYGSHWYTDPSNFLTIFDHADLIEAVKRETGIDRSDKTRQHQFTKHYYGRYNDPELPASWMVAEVLSLGTWSSIFARLAKKRDQKQIVTRFGLPIDVMTSWLHSLTYVRNLCAHHARVWNRTLVVRPTIMSGYEDLLKDNGKLYALLVVIQVFLDTVSPTSDWRVRLKKLIDDHPGTPIEAMGFTPDWHTQTFWNMPT
jgi:abortive infection bacteriophage resistance protein